MKKHSRYTVSALICGLDVHKNSNSTKILNSKRNMLNLARIDDDEILSFLDDHDMDRIGIEI